MSRTRHKTLARDLKSRARLKNELELVFHLKTIFPWVPEVLRDQEFQMSLAIAKRTCGNIFLYPLKDIHR